MLNKSCLDMEVTEVVEKREWQKAAKKVKPFASCCCQGGVTCRACILPTA